jgi:hypothetical protein
LARSDKPANLYEPVPGDYAAHARFDDEARTYGWERFTGQFTGRSPTGIAMRYLAAR